MWDCFEFVATADTAAPSAAQSALPLAVADAAAAEDVDGNQESLAQVVEFSGFQAV
jgi:hypothetical protein